MNIKVLIIGAILELSYLAHLAITNLPKLSITPMFLEFVKHSSFQMIVLAIILVGAFMNGKKVINNKKK